RIGAHGELAAGATVGDLVEGGVDGADLALTVADLVGLADDRLDPAQPLVAPTIAWGSPSAGASPQLVLVAPPVRPEDVLRTCVDAGAWCVVEQLGGEPRPVLLDRVDAVRATTAAGWTAAFGDTIPAGVSAAWLVPGSGDAPWTIAHPSGS
ncbi:MAG: hypothetical protein ABMB14_11715, partial [Myxococcota bacterium]